MSNQVLYTGIGNNETKTKTFLISQIYDIIKAKIYIDSSNDVYFSEIKITFNDIEYTFTDINNTINSGDVGVDNTVGWLDGQSINGPQIRNYTDIYYSEPEPEPEPEPISFNKIRLIKTSNEQSFWNITEVELYIGGVNICRLANVTVSTNTDSSSYSPSAIIDGGNVTGASTQTPDGTFWLGQGNVGKYLEINLVQDYDLSKIEFLMIYNRSHSSVAVQNRMLGTSIQLISTGDIMYTYEINTIEYYYRFDGDSMTSSIASASPANNVANNTDTIP